MACFVEGECAASPGGGDDSEEDEDEDEELDDFIASDGEGEDEDDGEGGIGAMAAYVQNAMMQDVDGGVGVGVGVGEEEEEEEEDEDLEALDEVASMTPTLDRLWPQFSTYEIPLPEQDIAECGDELCRKWMRGADRAGDNNIAAAYRLYGFRPDYAVDLDTLNSRHEDNVKRVVAYFRRLVNMNIIDPNSESAISNRIMRILEIMQNLRDIIMMDLRTQDCCDESVDLGERRGLDLFQFVFQKMEDLKPYQTLLLHLLNLASHASYRKRGKLLFRQIKTGGVSAEEAVDGVAVMPCYTHAWEEAMSIETFVYESVRKETNFAQWRNMTVNPTNTSKAIVHLEKAYDLEIPRLEVDRHVFSFRNGIYDATLDRYYGYSDGDIDTTLVAAKFFDQEYDTAALRHADWRRIPAAVDKILEDQGFATGGWDATTGAREWLEADLMWAFIGRMIYDIDEFDSWQVISFLKGKAATGKSTIGKLVAHMYDPTMVGILSANQEKKFGISPLLGKFFYICLEVKREMGLSQAEFQSMVSGEQLAVAIKFQDARSITWSTHGMLCGNEVPGWVDASGSVARRVLLWMFNTSIRNGDPTLFPRCKNDMAAFITKANKAYRELADTHGDKDIWKVLPPSFSVNQAKLRADTHSLASLLLHSEDLEFANDAYMPLSELQILCSHYASTNNFAAQMWNGDFYETVFEQNGLCVEGGLRVYDGRQKDTTWVLGVRKKDNA